MSVLPVAGQQPQMRSSSGSLQGSTASKQGEIDLDELYSSTCSVSSQQGHSVLEGHVGLQHPQQQQHRVRHMEALLLHSQHIFFVRVVWPVVWGVGV